MALSASAAASTALKFDLERLTLSSDRILVGEVVEMESFREDNRIYTDTTLRVEETWKGDAPDTITIRQPGGRVGDVATRVQGLAKFQMGERSLVFLSDPDTEDHPWVIRGLAQGKFRVTTGPDGETTLAVPDLDGLQVMAPQADGGADVHWSPDASMKELIQGGAAMRISTPSELHQKPHVLEDLKAAVGEILDAADGEVQ
jgi:hypothetical protein